MKRSMTQLLEDVLLTITILILRLCMSLPNDTSQLNSFMCSGLNRTGLLCSQCQQGLGPAILSFKRQCVECFDQRYGWLLYITATLFPTTILCILTMAFQFNVTSAEMNTFVFFLSDDNMCKYTCKLVHIFSLFHSHSLFCVSSNNFLWNLELRFLSILYSFIFYQQ